MERAAGGHDGPVVVGMTDVVDTTSTADLVGTA
jgi:hypothetical protein